MKLTENDYSLLLARLAKLDTTPLEREYRGERLTVCVREVGKPWPVIAVLRMVYERPRDLPPALYPDCLKERGSKCSLFLY